MHKAAHKGDIEEVKKWIEGPPDEGEDLVDVNAPGAQDRRALHRAAGAGHLELCKYLVEKGALVNQVDKTGRTSLHWATISGHTEIIKYLMGAGADIFAASSNGMTCLHAAVEVGLKAQGGSPDPLTYLMSIIKDDEPKRLQLCAMKCDGKTAWETAVAAKSKPICTILKVNGDPQGVNSACVIC